MARLKYIILSLTFIACSASLAGWLPNINPQLNENYYRLQKALDLYESLQTHSWPEITTFPLKIGSSNPLLPELRERLRLLGDLLPQDDTQSETVDLKLEFAVKRFQWRTHLTPDGIIGSRTLRELNVSPYERAEEIRRNMERWAQLPPDLGKRFVFINIPEYRFDLVEYGKSILNMKVIVGKPTRPTPELQSAINQVEINPYWNIPPQIIRRDILPKVLQDPHYLEGMNIKVLQHRKSGIVFYDPLTIHWQDSLRDGFNYELRQEPGKNNALGLVKFDFQNDFDVYMHDTPAKELFSRDDRIFSSGCIRLEKPFALLSYLLSAHKEWDTHKLAETLGSGKLTLIRVEPLRLYIVYITAWVDRSGVLHFLRDPYGYNEDPNQDDASLQANIEDRFSIPLSFYA